MVGAANEGEITICGTNTVGLIDSGSMITSISKSFYESLNPVPELHDITEFGLSVIGANGCKLPYKGYIEADISVPRLGKNSVNKIPLLVVTNTEYNSKIPAIIRTNVIRLYQDTSSASGNPEEWQTAFNSLCNNTVPVKTTNNFNIRVGPGEVKTINGIARKAGNIGFAVTEHIDSSLSGDLTVCPRVVSLKSSGTTVWVPVRVCNLSARVIEIPPKSLLCSLTGVNVFDSWTPDLSQMQETKSTTTSLEDLGVNIDTDNLTADQLNTTKQVLNKWSDIFWKGPTDLGKANIVTHEIKLTDETPFKEP